MRWQVTRPAYPRTVAPEHDRLASHPSFRRKAGRRFIGNGWDGLVEPKQHIDRGAIARGESRFARSPDESGEMTESFRANLEVCPLWVR